ncbi:MAG: hypothetical protein K0R18_358 [Bacillales bacterium]|jgi:hypothetical protein|nr:hypothetical protein [Bacillales bacterium]
MKNEKKKFVDEIARECIEFSKNGKGNLVKRIILIRKAQEFRTFPDQLEMEIMERMEELKASQMEETEEEKERKFARTVLRGCKRNGTPITKESARYLFAQAGWNYNESSTYLEIPEEDN